MALTTALTGAGSAAPALAHAPLAQTSAAHSAAPHAHGTGLAQFRRMTVIQRRNGRFGPFGANPTTAFVPRSDGVDWGGWRRSEATRSRAAAKQRTALRAGAGRAALAAPTPRYVREDEPAGTRGGNDSFRSAQPISRFGTGRGSYPAYTVLGQQSPAPAPTLDEVAPSTEPDDSLETARDTGVDTQHAGISTTGTIGDNLPDPKDPQATDNDLYKVRLKAGEQISLTVRRASGDLMPATALIDGDGNLVSWGDDTDDSSSVTAFVRSAGTYYLVVGGYTIIDLESGAATVTKGKYNLSLYARPGDRDVFKISLQAGDVLGASVSGHAGYVSVFDAKGTEVHGSPGDASSAYPGDSPLPGGGSAVTDHVVGRTGTYYVEVSAGDGAYQAQLEVYRYGGAARKQIQTIFLDTDGQRLNTGPLGGRGVTTLSPLRSFLGRWGVPRSREKAVIKKIKATVQENLDADLRRSGLSKYVSVKVVTSLDTKDPWGKAGVSRVIVGGTIDESGIPTIGIANSIDPGNFDRTETALVLLDVLSGDPAEWDDASLNKFITARSNRVDFVGHAVGNVVSHEAGHFIGNWHTDNGDHTANLMDAGGENFGLLFGVGPDQIGGTKDDRDVDFGRDAYQPDEGFTGIEDTLARSTFGMSTRP